MYVLYNIFFASFVIHHKHLGRAHFQKYLFIVTFSSIYKLEQVHFLPIEPLTITSLDKHFLEYIINQKLVLHILSDKMPYKKRIVSRKEDYHVKRTLVKVFK